MSRARVIGIEACLAAWHRPASSRGTRSRPWSQARRGAIPWSGTGPPYLISRVIGRPAPILQAYFESCFLAAATSFWSWAGVLSVASCWNSAMENTMEPPESMADDGHDPELAAASLCGTLESANHVTGGGSGLVSHDSAPRFGRHHGAGLRASA